MSQPMDYKDYYQIMGLKNDATPEDIKRSYRKLARKYHPDVSKEANAEAKFKELGEAYDVLRDPEKRAKYDQYGQYWREQSQASANPYANQQRQSYYQNFDEGQAAGFEDFINSIFRERSGRRQHSYNEKAEDIHASLAISLEDSFTGAVKTLQLQTPIVDEYGNANYHNRAVKVKIPKGIGNKQQIRLKGQGMKGAQQHAGDLYIEINISSHPLFSLEKSNIYLKVPISPWEAALGATIQVPTLAGSVNLKIPKLSQNGKQMRLKGRGLPSKVPGDQIITLEIVIPKTANPETDALYEQLAKVSHFNPREKLGVSND